MGPPPVHAERSLLAARSNLGGRIRAEVSNFVGIVMRGSLRKLRPRHSHTFLYNTVQHIQEPALFLQKQTAILLPSQTWCSGSTPEKKKTDMSAVCESNQLVKSFVSSLSFSLTSPFSSGPWFFEGLAPFATIGRHASCTSMFVGMTAPPSFFRPIPFPSFRATPTPGRCVAVGAAWTTHGRHRRSKSASLHPLFGIC